MKIINHKLTGTGVKPFEPTTKTSGEFEEGKLDTLMIHYTASPTFQSAYQTLMNPKVKASAHLLIDWDGTVLQMMSFDKTTWHAGKSFYQDRKYFNQYSIGIEIVNPGYLYKKGGYFEDVYENKYSSDKVFEGKHRNNPNMPDYWHAYSQDQINTVYNIASLLAKEYDLKYILGHEEVAVGRKSDPGPAFPLDQMRSVIFRGFRPSHTKTINIDPPAIRGWVYKAYIGLENDNTSEGLVTASHLNIRSGRSTKAPTVSRPLLQNTKVKILQTNGNWYEVLAYVS